MKHVRIVLADDHHLVRAGLRALLSVQADFEIVGEIGDGLETMKLVEKLQPDVLVLDVMMPGLNGLAVAKQVCRRCPHTHVVMLSMHSNVAYVAEAIRNGASAYVLKDSTAADLATAVRSVTAGRLFLSAPLKESDVLSYEQRMRNGLADPYETLTEREREVLQLVAEGGTNQSVAKRLSISPRTVETHRSRVMSKLHLCSSAELVRFAFNRGIIPADTTPPPKRV
jgi:DNA-binding NarL/FixJ family response regulator